MQTTDIVATPHSGAIVTTELTEEQKALVKRTIAKGTTDDEFAMFLHVCKTRRVDPFSKMIYPVKRYDSKERKEVMALQNSIDYSRLVADRSLVYEGQVGPQWCGDDGAWKDVWLDDKRPPTAARVGVWRKGFREPLFATALWSNYVQTDRDGKPTKFWRQMGPLMLGKCAEALALRRAFPEDLAGMYTPEEMSQAANDAVEVVDVRTGEVAPLLAKPPQKDTARVVDAKPVPEAQPAPPTQPAKPQATPRVYYGVPVADKVWGDFDSWKHYKAVENPASKSALRGMTWEDVLEYPSEDRYQGRLRSLVWACDTGVQAINDGKPLTLFAQRAAYVRHLIEETKLNAAPFDEEAERERDAATAPFAPPDYGWDSADAPQDE